MRFRRKLPDRRAARLIALSATRAHPAPGGAASASEGVRALARVVDAYPDASLLGDRSAAAALREAVRTLCAEARTADPLRAERLLIELRGVWEELPEVRRVPDHDGARRALWDVVVALCVREFYEPAAGDAAATAATAA